MAQKKLIIKNFDKGQANSLTALASANGNLRYGNLGDDNEVTLDITTLLKNRITGSSFDVALYVEKSINEGSSASISTQPVAFSVEVGVGEAHSLTYDADGGSGATLPAAMQVKAGSSVVLANGSTLQKAGNMFSRWVATYVDDGAKVNLILKAGETFLMPDSDVVITAQYSGMQIGKGTATEGATNFIVTFDLNGGTMNGYSTSRIPIKVRKGAKIGNPFAEDPLKDGIFKGWFTKAEGGNEVDIENFAPSGNVIFYAQYGFNLDSDNVTFLARSGTDPYKLMKGQITEKAYSLSRVKRAAEKLKDGINPDENVFNATNDSYHLFSKISGDGSHPND